MKMSDAELIACKAKIVSLETSVAIYERALKAAHTVPDQVGQIAHFQFACMRFATEGELASERKRLAAHREAETPKVERAS